MLKQYKEVWLVDNEFNATSGNNPEVICLVAHELHSNQVIKLWSHELFELSSPPYSMGKDALFIAYYATAKFSCHLSMGWELPVNVLDLFVEFRNFTNGKKLKAGNGLLGALSAFNLPAIDSDEKNEMRNLALRGGPWSNAEQDALLKYCESDVLALKQLLPKILPNIQLPHALISGRYMRAVAKMEFA